jgi:hypothetical protein
MIGEAIERALKTSMKNVSDLTDNLNLSYENKFGETISFKVDEHGNAYYNHSDIHSTEFEFYPTETRHFVVLDADEKEIFNLFETMAYIQRKNSIK